LTSQRASKRGRSRKCVLVTGGAGFVGSHLVERLLADGCAVVVIDDFSTGSERNLDAVSADPRLEVIRSTVSACGELPRLMARAAAVYHLAAAVGVERILESPLGAIRTNLRETEVLLEAAAGERVPVLLTSSSEVYGKSGRSEFAEDDDLLIGPPTCSRWAYACSKLTDEFLALAYARERGLPVVIARLFNAVGPRQVGRYGMVLPRFIEAARRGEPLRVFGSGHQRRCFCYVGDAVEALVRLQAAPLARGQIFNVGGTQEVSIVALARMVIQLLGSGSRIEKVPYDEAYPRGFEDLRRRKPSVRKLFGAIGFRPATPLRRIILQTAGC
jgi:UDP-glucose 4-epimerase